METIENPEILPNEPSKKSMGPSRYNDTLGRVAGGLVLIVTGGVLFARKAGVYFPEWLFSFEMLMVVIGMFMWSRSAFRRPAGLIIMLIGGLFLLDNWIPNFHLGMYFWPIMIIAAGIWVIVGAGRRRRDKYRQHWQQRYTASSSFTAPDQATSPLFDSDEAIYSTAIFSGVKKTIVSKNFKGGRAESFFGGTELNFIAADLQSPQVLEIEQAFGGTKLIVPAHWVVRSEMVSILGGVEDKRKNALPNPDERQTLILRGTTIFGGVDIKGY